MEELTKRLDALSPERRKLLERLRSSAKTDNGDTAGDAGTAATAAPEKESNGTSTNSPFEPKTGLQQFYNAVTAQLDATVFGEFSFFLNYGYASTDSPEYAAVALPPHTINANSVKLVLELIGECPIDG